MAVAACRRGGGRAESTNPAPHLALADGRFDLGIIDQDETARRSFALKNTGTRTLEIGSIEPSRFCSAHVEPASIAPGAAARLEVSCKSDLYGPLRELIVLHTNDPAAAKAPVELVAQVTPRLALDAPSVELTMPFGQERSHDVALSGSKIGHAAPVLVPSAIAEDSAITPIAGTGGRIVGFHVRCLGRQVGVHAGNLVVRTGLEIPAEIAMPYSCRVAGTLEVLPTNPYFDMKLSGPKTVSVQVRSAKPGFALHSAQVTSGPFAAGVEGPLSDGSFRVKVTVDEERIKDDARGVLGTLRLLSNDEAEPRKDVPLFGFGKLAEQSPPKQPPAP